METDYFFQIKSKCGLPNNSSCHRVTKYEFDFLYHYEIIPITNKIFFGTIFLDEYYDGSFIICDDDNEFPGFYIPDSLEYLMHILRN